MFFAVAAFPFIWLASVNPRLALYAGFGAYGGALFSMQQSTPSSLLLDIPEETRMIELLDNSRLLKLSGNVLEI
ncbi:MAG TPA: hypothetical protein VLM36_09190, partial [Sphingomicrobium sp.]|nr:hypothetical protein [Sphingomicrobium sp.]